MDSTVESSNDFNPIRNWANELHAKDTSRKVRAVMRMKAEQGERLGGRSPYGYRKSDGDANTLVPDEDTAPVVKRIFSLCAAGNGPKRIATILTKEQVVNPSNAYYWLQSAVGSPRALPRGNAVTAVTSAELPENCLHRFLLFSPDSCCFAKHHPSRRQ